MYTFKSSPIENKWAFSSQEQTHESSIKYSVDQIPNDLSSGCMSDKIFETVYTLEQGFKHINLYVSTYEKIPFKNMYILVLRVIRKDVWLKVGGIKILTIYGMMYVYTSNCGLNLLINVISVTLKFCIVKNKNIW